MNLVDSLLDLGQRSYGVDWQQTQAQVALRLRLQPACPRDVLDPRRFPTYWCVPLLVGDYVQATPAAVAQDLPPFLAGCLVRHFAHDPDPPLTPAPDDTLVILIKEAYEAHGLTAVHDLSFDARFAEKCRPWTVLLGVGTQRIQAAVADRPESYAAAVQAIVRVYSCLQLVDDWHDQTDDAARAHWNCWTDEPLATTLGVLEPLIAGAQASVAALRAGLLRRALAAQLQDAAADLADIVAEHPIAFLQRRRGSGGTDLWRDFELATISRGSTECISAFIATQLAPIPAARGLAVAAVQRLLPAQRPEGGWGYREDVPADCDSTAWVMIAAAAVGVRPLGSVAAGAESFILEHQDAGGGFVTYRPELRHVLTPGDRPGWFAPEVSVTASALLALLALGHQEQDRLQRIGDYLIDRRTGDLWTSYWWKGVGYPTMLACSALRQLDPVRYGAELSAAAQALWAARSPDGGWAGEPGAADDPFSTALAVQTLIGTSRSDVRSRLGPSVAYLLDQRSPAGGFRPGAAMLAPGAGEDGTDRLLLDQGSVTTAAVAAALHLVKTPGRCPG